MDGTNAHFMHNVSSNDKTHERFENDSHSEMTNSLQAVSFIYIYVHTLRVSTLGYIPSSDNWNPTLTWMGMYCDLSIHDVRLC